MSLSGTCIYFRYLGVDEIIENSEKRQKMDSIIYNSKTTPKHQPKTYTSTPAPQAPSLLVLSDVSKITTSDSDQNVV